MESVALWERDLRKAMIITRSWENNFYENLSASRAVYFTDDKEKDETLDSFQKLERFQKEIQQIVLHIHDKYKKKNGG